MSLPSESGLYVAVPVSRNFQISPWMTRPVVDVLKSWMGVSFESCGGQTPDFASAKLS
jgi:hypothetical protein